MTSPSSLYLYLNTHLLLRALQSTRGLTRDYILLPRSEFILSLAAYNHFSWPLYNIASFQDFSSYSSLGIISAIKANALALERCASLAMPWN